MYIISYERCVCFIFLVILAVFSCAGYRIDNLAMTEVSSTNSNSGNKRNTTPSDNRTISGSAVNLVRHRIRHHHDRQARTKLIPASAKLYDTPRSEPTDYLITSHNRFPTIPFLNDNKEISTRLQTPYRYHFPSDRSKTNEYSPSYDRSHSNVLTSSTDLTQRSQTERYHLQSNLQNDSPVLSHPTTNERLSQIPSPSFSRSQRSSKRPKRGKKQSHCYHEDVSAKAYKAQIVLRVLAESMSKRRDAKYSVHFKVLEHYKNSSLPIHDHIQLTFSNGSSSRNCDESVGGRPTRFNLVKVDIRATQEEYVLFLNSSGAHSYYPTGVPEKLRRNPKKNRYIYNMLRKVCNPNFTPRPPEIVQLEDVTSRRQHTTPHRLRLVCKAKGLPIPRITWRRNKVDLHGGRHVRINYKRRKSTLVIKRTGADDGRGSISRGGTYVCVARGVDGVEVTRSIDIPAAPTAPRRPASTSPPFKKPCEEPHLTNFCLNGGQCFMDPDPLERYCECPNGYDGKRCEMKTFNQPSISDMMDYQDFVYKNT